MLDVTDSIVVVVISDATDDRSDDVCCKLEDNTADVKSPSGAEAADETICVLASDIFDVEEIDES